MTVVELIFRFVAGNFDFFHIGHDDKVTGIDVRRKDSFVLTAQAVRYRAGKPSQHLIRAIDDIPISRNFLGFGGEGFHDKMPAPLNFAKS